MAPVPPRPEPPELPAPPLTLDLLALLEAVDRVIAAIPSPVLHKVVARPLDAEAITRAFRHLASEGCAVVITGHEVGMLFEAADKVTWCNAGTTREYLSTAVAREDWSFQRDYLGMEQQRAVLRASE